MGWQELLFILLIGLVLFGAKRLPEIGRSLGRSITSFKEGVKEKDPEEPKDDPVTTDKTKD